MSASRRIGVSLAAGCLAVAVAMASYLEATVLAHVAAPEVAAAAGVAGRLAPPPASKEHLKERS